MRLLATLALLFSTNAVFAHPQIDLHTHDADTELEQPARS
jgi:hypothetical protein